MSKTKNTPADTEAGTTISVPAAIARADALGISVQERRSHCSLATTEPRVGDLLAAVVEKGINAEAVGVVRELIAMKREQELYEAKKEFAAAFAAMQAELPEIIATKAVPNNDGSLRYRYAPEEDVWRQVKPYMTKYGFSRSYSTLPVEAGRVTVTCTLMHKGGHERTNPYSVRIGSGPPKATETQADGSAYSYAQRNALLDALGISVAGRDNEPRDVGPAVTSEQARALLKRVAATQSDIEKFLKYAGAAQPKDNSQAEILKAFESIPAGRYHSLDELLLKKENGA